MSLSIEEFKIGLEKCSAKTRTDHPDLSFDWAGLIPTFDESDKYWCTPLNSQMIARTGGDGVHYSVLELGQGISPVIMTVPANFGNSLADYNIILAENIDEFIAIGSMEGWFALEQIVYEGDQFYTNYGSTHLSDLLSDSSDGYFVNCIVSYFKVVKARLTKDRLLELKNSYFNLLSFSEEFIQAMILQ